MRYIQRLNHAYRFNTVVFIVLRLKPVAKYNYLLTGNKVTSLFHRVELEGSEKNNNWIVHRGEIKAPSPGYSGRWVENGNGEIA